jgi:hypothetical protein
VFPSEWDERADAALRKVQGSVNKQLGRQYEQLVDSLHSFLDDLFNYPLLEDWRRSLARFADHWAERGLILTRRTLAAIERLIDERIDGSVAVMLAEAPVADSANAAIATDATLPLAPKPRSSPEARDTDADRGLLGYQFTAVQLGREEQLLLGLTDGERKEYEQFIVESLRARANGQQPPLPPLAYYEKKREWMARQAAQPSMRDVTRAEQERSILKWKYAHLDELPPEEQARLQFVFLTEERRKFAANYGLLAAFLNPAFNDTGTLDDWSNITAFALTPSAPPEIQGGSLASRPRGPRASVPRRPQPPKTRNLPGRRPPEKEPTKPYFPPPVAKVRVTKRRDKKTPDPSHVASVKSEEAAARAIHKLPNEVVIYWGIKSGAHGPDVISYNLKTRIVTLWDVKWRGSPMRIRPSTTFRADSRPLANSLQIARLAIKNSQLSSADKDAAFKSLDNKTFETRTLGAGASKNSTFGDHQ